MTVDAEFTLKIQMKDLNFPNNISAFEMRRLLLAEGEKRLKLLDTGFLRDPEGKVVQKDVNYKIKED